MDAFMLAGDGRESHRVMGTHKALLVLDHRPLFLHVLAALNAVPQIERIYLVGPKAHLIEAMRTVPDVPIQKPWAIIEQRGTLLENALSAYNEAFDPRCGGTGLPALFLSADIPLVTSKEIETFIARSDMETSDYCIGVTSEESLLSFYPGRSRPGIRMPYLYLDRAAYRMNNMHIARPHRIGALALIQKAYEVRYQTHLLNMLKTFWKMLSMPTAWEGLRFYLCAQGARIGLGLHLASLAAICRRGLTVSALNHLLSRLLDTRVKIVEIEMGGGALDIDSESAYTTLLQHYAEWRLLCHMPHKMIPH